jgi:high affinity sulfate transporter 1
MRWRADAVAGLTTAAVVIPKSMAYAAIGGLPVAIGLYTALVPMVVYAAVGTSRRLSVSTTSTLAVLTAAAAAPVATGDTVQLQIAAASLTLATGATLLLAGVCRLGFLAEFISAPVLIGFKAGTAAVIITDQLPKLLGLHLPKSPTIMQAADTFQHIAGASLPTLIVGLAVLALIVALERFAPAVPAPLAATALAIIVAAVTNLDRLGVELVGAFEPGLPAPALPDLALAAALWPAALGIALMSFVESIAAGRAFVGRGEPLPRANRELVAVGLSNIAGSVFSNMPSGGVTSQTALNSAAGARSQVSGAVTAMMVAATLLVLSPVMALLPHAALAAVVIATTAGLLRPADFAAIRAVRSMEFWWAIAAFAGVIAFGTLNGVLVAVAISVLALMYEANRPPVYEVESVPGLLILRTEGRIHFANARRVGDEMWTHVRRCRPEVLALEMSAIADLEYTALTALIEAEGRLREAGTELWLVAVNPGVRQVMRRSPLEEVLGTDRIHADVKSAIAVFAARRAAQNAS